MEMRLLLILPVAVSLLGQDFYLGKPNDPCVGGYPLTFGAGSTLRYGSFTCTFPVAPGSYRVRLGFQEPVATAVGQRVFDVFVDDQPVLHIDLYASGVTNPSIVIARAFNVQLTGSQVTIKIVPTVGSGRLSTVSLSPAEFVPYSGAAKDVDLGNFAIRAKAVRIVRTLDGFRGYIVAGPAPTNTISSDDGALYDAVIFLDAADKKLKILKQDGTVVSLE